MSLKLFTLSLCLIVTTSGYNRETNVSVDILALSDETLGVDDEFKFKCNATLNATISLVIDGIYNNTKLDRIVSRSVPHENAVEYTFQYTTAYDNGTTFMCHAEAPNKKDNESHSETLTIQIQYAPYFEQGNNVTILQQFYKGKDGTLDCSVLMANPQIMPLKFTNTSKNTSNVHTKVTGEKGEITFSNATIDNKGKYSCIATNAIGSTTLTYNTFVGGAPDKLEVIPTVAVANESLLIGLELNDESDAPALSLSYSIGGLIGEKVIWFQNRNYSIPVHHLSTQEVDQSLKFVDAGNYTLIVKAFNQLGNVTVLNKTYYIPGINLDVDIESSMQNVTRGNNYSFTCLTKKTDINFTVLVDYSVNSSKANRIFKGEKTTKSQEFIFTNTSYKDNGTVFQCVAEHVYKSDPNYMTVLYPPVYFNATGQLSMIYGTKNATVNMFKYTSNPKITKFTWMKDGKEIKSTNLVTVINETALMFNPPLKDDKGTYTVTAENSIGSGDGSAILDVHWAPELVSPVQLPTLRAGNTKFEVTLNISANPGITYTRWIQNGHDVTNITNISPGLFTMTFTSLTHSDNGSYSAIVFNDVGNLTVYFDLMVLWAPELVTPVQLPTLKAGNTTFVVKLNISANPGITSTQWIQNGHNINDTNISLGLTTMKFTSLTPYDNGSYSAIVFNDVGNLTVYFDMMVLYAPMITLPSRLGAFLNSTFVFNVSVCANPTNYTIQFMKDGKELKPSDNLHIDKNVLTFKPISNSDNGNYTVKVTNIVGSTEEDFTLHVYDGPFFEQGAANTTVLTEMRSGSDVNLTCTIKSSSPPVTDLIIIPNNGPNFKTENNGVKSVTLIVNKAEAKSNTRYFTCKAINEFTTSTLTFDNYVGGVPDKLHVEVVITDDSDKQTFKFTFNVTDDSLAPATGLLVHLEGSTKGNKSLTIQKPPLKGASITFKDAIEENYSDLEGHTGIINMYGVNKIGTVKLKDYQFNYPTAPPRTKNDRSKDIKIALGVSIPILVLVIIAFIAAIAVGFFYYKKKSLATSGERSPLMGGKTIQE